jgi:uncharacterized oligopeptide transporter (OPT) family protein
VLLDRFLPENLRPFVPSPTGVGLAFVIPAFNSISMFIGSLIALVLYRSRPATAETYVIPVASGIVAGESLMGVAIALLSATGVLH